MVMRDAQLRANTYPGRGMVLGISQDGKHAVQVYWTMGRSANSKKRIMTEENGCIKTVPTTTEDLVRPELVIYNVTSQSGGTHVVSNGQQTDAISQGLQSGESLESCLEDWMFEHDGPIYTPRITGVTRVDAGSASYQLSIIKAPGNNPDVCARQVFSYSAGTPGVGHCIHTYAQNGDPCPPFSGEPFCVPLSGQMPEVLDAYWEMLPADYMVAMLVKFVNLHTGEYEIVYRNASAR